MAAPLRAGSFTASSLTIGNGGVLNVTGPATLPAQESLAVQSGGTLALGVGGAERTPGDISTFLSTYSDNFAQGSSLGLDTTGGNFTYENDATWVFGLAALGPHTLALSGAGTFTALAISGGCTLAVSDLSQVADGGGVTLNVGTLEAAGAFTTTMPITIAGSGTVDTNGHDVTVGGNISDPEGIGTGTAIGTLIKTGAAR